MCPLLLLLLLLLLIKSSRGVEVVGGVRGEVTRDRPTDQLSAGQPLRSAIFPTLLMVVKAVFCFQSFCLLLLLLLLPWLFHHRRLPLAEVSVSKWSAMEMDGWMVGGDISVCVCVLMKFEFFLFATFFDFAFHFTCDHRF